MQDIEAIRVLNRRDAIARLVCQSAPFSGSKQAATARLKLDLSEGRVGYRVCDLAAWLDARREVQSARELIDSNWKQVGAAASKIVERPR